jgi:hypothetical protein
MSAKEFKVSISNVLLPLLLVSFTLFLTLAFQMTQIMRDREALHQAKMQQDKPMEDAQKLQAQLTALALGTKKLADSGDKDAQNIIAQLKQNGITVAEPATTSAPGAMAPKPALAPVGGQGGAAPAAAPAAPADQP